jgi:hypothetical protein
VKRYRRDGPPISAHGRTGRAATPEVQEVFQFMLAVAMEDSGTARLIDRSHTDSRTWYSYESASGEVYSVVRSGTGSGMETR